MPAEIRNFDEAFNEKVMAQTKDVRIRARLRKLAQELAAKKDQTQEPVGLASGLCDENGKMIIDLVED